MEKLKKMMEKETLSDADFDVLRKDNLEGTQEMIAVFDKAIKSRWTHGTTKFYYEMFRDVLAMQGSNVNNFLCLLQWYQDLRDAVIELSGEVQQIRGKDLGKLTKRMNKILKNPAVKMINAILDKDMETIKKINERRQEIIKKSVV
jgi:alpha-amylase/alpha-mannosidase (GH57 family)